ncbi:hypothetical protein [Vibrio owensii]|uniref:hypothetical protein n=1 Tax=Vibrio owensii TaxID=696485 RepID=UPI002FEE6FBA
MGRAREKMVSRINRIERENEELKERLAKYESGELEPQINDQTPDSVVWAMNVSLTRQKNNLRSIALQYAGDIIDLEEKNKNLEERVSELEEVERLSEERTQTAEDLASAQKELIEELESKLKDADAYIGSLKFANDNKAKEIASLEEQRDAALLEFEFKLMEEAPAMNAIIKENVRLSGIIDKLSS